MKGFTLRRDFLYNAGPHQRVEGTDVDMSPGKRLSTGEGAGRRLWAWMANEDMDGKEYDEGQKNAEDWKEAEVIGRCGRWMTGVEGTWQVLKKAMCVEYEEDADDVEGDGNK